MTAATATATEPPTASRRRRPDAQPAGQQTRARTGTPIAAARPAKPAHRAAGSATATAGSVVSGPAAAPAATNSASPTTNEYAPEMGCESAEMTR